MDSTIIAALIGATATVIAALIAAWVKNRDHNPEAPKGRNASSPRQPVISTKGASDVGLSIEEAIAILENEGGTRAGSANPGSSFYETAKNIRFARCDCSYADPTYGAHEYIGRSGRGICHYVSYYLKTGNITCGPKGFHYCRPDVAECIS